MEELWGTVEEVEDGDAGLLVVVEDRGEEGWRGKR